MRFLKTRLALVIVIIVPFMLFTAVACKSKKETGVTKAKPSLSRVSLAGTLVESLPEDTFGFGYFNLAHPAYKKLLASPWGANNDWMGISQKNPRFVEIQEVLSEFGLDLNNPASLSTIITEGVVFLSIVENSAPIALLFRTPSANKMEEFRSKLESQLKEKGKVVEALEFGDKKGFRLQLPVSSAGETPGVEADKNSQEVVFLTLSDRGIFAASEELAKKGLVETKAMPKFLESAEYKEVSKGLGDDDSTYAYGYVDLAMLLGHYKADYDRLAKGQEAALGAAQSVQSIAWSVSMKATPEQELRLQLTEKGRKSVNEFSISSGEALAKFMPPTPMLALSLDASLFSPIIDAVKANQGSSFSIEKQVPWLKDLKKIGLAISVTQPGVLPIPSVAISFQVNDAKSVEEFLKITLQQGILATGMVADPKWQSVEKDGVVMHSMVGPMGVSLNLVSKDGVVLIANNPQELSAMLAGTKKPSELINSTMSPERFFTLNIDFIETAKFMQNMRGVLGLYAPQDESTKELLSDEKIELIKKMGLFAATLDKAEGMLVLKSEYHVK